MFNNLNKIISEMEEKELLVENEKDLLDDEDVLFIESLEGDVEEFEEAEEPVKDEFDIKTNRLGEPVSQHDLRNLEIDTVDKDYNLTDFLVEDDELDEVGIEEAEEPITDEFDIETDSVSEPVSKHDLRNLEIDTADKDYNLTDFLVEDELEDMEIEGSLSGDFSLEEAKNVNMEEFDRDVHDIDIANYEEIAFDYDLNDHITEDDEDLGTKDDDEDYEDTEEDLEDDIDDVMDDEDVEDDIDLDEDEVEDDEVLLDV